MEKELTTDTEVEFIFDNSSPTIKNTLFKDNYTRERGGAVYIENSNSNPVFQNVVFMQNTAGSNGDGGAIYVNDYATLTLSHCTITKNTASDGGAIRYDDDGFATIYNSIIYNNTSTNNPDTLNAELSFNNTKTSYAAFVTRNGNTIKNNFFQYFTEGINNSNTNPSFGSEGFSLNDNSPAINKGDISIFTEYYNAGEKWRDVGGRERWVGSSIDLGAWEKQCKIPVPIADNSTVSLCGISTVGDLIAKINSGTLEVYPNSNTNEKLPTTTALVNNATYYIVKFENKCNSDRVAVKVTINVIPSAPNGATANAFLCQGVNNYFKNITVSQGSNPKWYTSMTGGTAIDPNTYEIQNGVKYYVAASNNGCESSRFEASFTVNPRLSAPSGNLNQNFVQGATVSDLVMDQTNIFWYGSLADANSGSNLLPGTQLLVTKKYYAVRHSDTSCNSAATEVNVTVNPLATSEASQQTAEVYPNPVKDVLTIKNEQIITSIDIYDASGKLISQTQHKEKTVSVNMKDLPVGNYIISIYSEGKVMKKKVIKK